MIPIQTDIPMPGDEDQRGSAYTGVKTKGGLYRRRRRTNRRLVACILCLSYVVSPTEIDDDDMPTPAPPVPPKVYIPEEPPNSRNGRAFDPASVAMCLVGHARTMMHPVMLAANSMAFAHLPNMRTFAVLQLEELQVNRTEHLHSFFPKTDSHMSEDPEEWMRHHAVHLEATYKVSVDDGTLFVMSHNQTFASEFTGPNGHCGRNGSCVKFAMFTPADIPTPVLACENRELMEMRSLARESGESYAEQLWKVFHCGRMIESYELRYSMRFQWVFKSRPDVLPLQPWVSPRHLNKNKVYANWATRDHIFACPRALCRGFLVDGPQSQLNCSAGPSFGKNGSKLEVMGYANFEFLDRFGTDYTLLRPDGPQCPGWGPHSVNKFQNPCKDIKELMSRYSHSKNTAALQKEVEELESAMEGTFRAVRTSSW